MASVTFPTSLGGDGNTYTDDSNATTGLANGGHRTRFVPCLSNTVIMASTAKTQAGLAATSETNAETYKNQAVSSAAAAAISESNAATSAGLAQAYATAIETDGVNVTGPIRFTRMQITEDITFPSGYNGVSPGPVEILSDFLVDITIGSSWVIV